VEVASVEKMAFPLPDKPSIAVLPFANLSDDPKQEYFVDGMTDDLITDLSKISGLFVIARNSVFKYKGEPVDVKKVSRELGVRYVLEGSVRRADNKVRINAQLIDATTGGHLWAERYDGEMGDVFALQDKITGKIVAALAVKLTAGEQELVARKDTDNMEAYDAFLQGWEHYLRLTFDGFAKARSCFEKSVELDPNYGQAYAALAQTYWIGSNLGLLGINFYEARLRASEYLQMAMKNPTSLAHQVAADMLLFRREHDEAIKAAERAIALNPHGPSAHWIMAHTLIMTGRPEVAVDFIKIAMRLDPHNPGRYWFLLGLAHFGMGQLEKTVTFIERALILHPEANKWAGPLAAAYAHLARDQEARAALDSYIEGWPYIFRWRFGTANLQKEMYFWPLKDPKTADRLADGLIKAGLSGQPSGYYKVSEENKLTGEEIRRLSFGRTVAGVDLWSGEKWWVDRTKEGETNFRGLYPGLTTGTSWIEGDMLCHQWQVHSGKRKYCGPVFRNPEGTPETKNEYLLITYIGIYPFSPVD
jgi:TolB-like protein